MKWPNGPYSKWQKLLIFFGFKKQKVFTGVRAEVKINGVVVGYINPADIQYGPIAPSESINVLGNYEATEHVKLQIEPLDLKGILKRVTYDDKHLKLWMKKNE